MANMRWTRCWCEQWRQCWMEVLLDERRQRLLDEWRQAAGWLCGEDEGGGRERRMVKEKE
ncbi:histone deacetylase [Sesbania bispinosa]|nr:histone deacetylase [Sesbania bispinosa]